MRRPLPILVAAAFVLAPAGAALAGGFGHHVYNPHFYGGRAPAVRGHCSPKIHHAPVVRRHCGPRFLHNSGGFVQFGYGTVGNRYYGDTFGGFVNHRALGVRNGFVTVNRGRISVGVPFNLPSRCGTGFSKKPHRGGFTHFSGVHNFYGGESSVRDYASYHASKRHCD